MVNTAACLLNVLNVFRMKIRGKHNQIISPKARLKKVRIRISGHNNKIIVGDGAKLSGVSVFIHGSNNTIIIGDRCTLLKTELHIEDCNNLIEIGCQTRIWGKTHLAAIEGTSIRIGKDCLFSSDVHFQTGDAHSVLNIDGCRVNESKDITIGNHVWIGTRVMCLKGAYVADHCIIGAGAIVTNRFEEPNCSLTGVPAKVKGKGVDWLLERIPLGEKAEAL